MFYNEWEVQSVVERTIGDAKLRPYAEFLRDWVTIVNSNSDGWAYWSAGNRAAQKLCNLLAATADSRCHVYPSEADLKKSLSPIKSIATKKGLPKPAFHGVKKTRSTKRVGTDDPSPVGLDAEGRDSDGNRREYW